MWWPYIARQQAISWTCGVWDPYCNMAPLGYKSQSTNVSDSIIATAMVMSNEIHIVSLNVRGLGDNTKCRQVLHWFENKNSKIVLLQETHSTTHTERLWKNEWDGDMFFSHGTGASKGVAFLFKQNVHKTIHKCITDKEGRYVVLDIELDDIRCTLVNLYAPNEDEPEFFIE